MKMLNVGIGPETGNTRELNSGDIDLHSLVRVFPIYRWDSTYKDKLIVHRKLLSLIIANPFVSI